MLIVDVVSAAKLHRHDPYDPGCGSLARLRVHLVCPAEMTLTSPLDPKPPQELLEAADLAVYSLILILLGPTNEARARWRMPAIGARRAHPLLRTPVAAL